MSEENSFFWLFFLEKNKMTHKNLKKAKKNFLHKKQNDKENTVLNTSQHNSIYNYKNISNI